MVELSVPGSRSEVMLANGKCFMGARAYRDSLHDKGMPTKIVETLHDSNQGVKTDMFSESRMFSNAMDLIEQFAKHNITHKQSFKKAGAIEEIKSCIQLGRTQEER